ncbi:MAG: response regulator, partial [Thiocapsa sp.]
MRLLLVEDDERLAEGLVAALTAAGFVVDRAADGRAAWFKGDTEPYAAVILDLGLPGMDGLSILRKWRANDQRFPVLILTARGD